MNKKEILKKTLDAIRSIPDSWDSSMFLEDHFRFDLRPEENITGEELDDILELFDDILIQRMTEGLIQPVDTLSVLGSILEERVRQDEKWGKENLSREEWMDIFFEEWGEASKAYIEKDKKSYIKELKEATAVLVAWIESEERD